jgi:hypothetical protein
MVKQRFTTRFDEHVMALAERMASAERRSVTSIFEVALIDYAAKKGVAIEEPITPTEADEVR